MSSRRKIEEEIARTKDPVIRKQLQELLDKRNQRQEQKKTKIINSLKNAANFAVDIIQSESKPMPWWFWLLILSPLIPVIFVIILYLMDVFSQ